MQLIFDAFEMSGITADARAGVLFGLGLMLLVMAVAFVTSVLLGGGHNGKYGGGDDD